MAICETCGGKFIPTKESPGCPRCEGQATSGAPAQPVKTGQPAHPAQTARPARPAGAAPAAGARPATPRPAAAAGAGSSPAAKPAAKPAAARPAAAGHASAGQAARPAPAKPAARRALPEEPEEEPEEPRQIHHPEPEGMLDQTSKIGLIAAGGLAVIVLIAVFVVSGKHKRERLAEEAYQNEVKNLYTELAALNLDDEMQAKSLLQKAKDKEGRWRDHELAPQIQTLIVRAGSSLETGKERREVLKRFTDIEKILADTSQLSPETLKETRRSLLEMEAKITLGGEEYAKRYSDACVTADKAYVTRLLEGATEGGANPRTALVQSQTAEDEIRKLLDTAITEKKQELQTFYTDLYKRAIAQSDQLATTLFTERAIADVPWIDCLSGEQAGRWTNANIKGFSREVNNGELRIVGPDAEAARQAVIVIGDTEQWRNLVLDMEYTIEKGNTELYLRLGRAANANTTFLPLKTEGDEQNRQAGKKYHMTLRLIGSHLSVRHEDEDLDTSPKDEDLSFTKTRKGGIGFLIPPNTRLRITSFKVRDLR